MTLQAGSWLPIVLAQAAQNPPAPGGSSGWTYVVAAALLGAAVLLLFLEIFLPSGGILGTLATLSLISGVVMCFRIDTTLGLISAILALIGLPVIVAVGIKLAPETPVFRMLALKAKQAPAIGRMATAGIDKLQGGEGEHADDGTTAAPAEASLVGERGEAVTELRPVGTCLIAGRREECLAVRGVIERGDRIEVVSQDGMHIKVKRVAAK